MTTLTRGLFDELFASRAMLEVFSDRARIEGMLAFESALAQAEAELGVIPATAAAPIVARCRTDDFDVSSIAAGAKSAGNAAIPLIAALRAAVAGHDASAARYVHFGATSQDAIDTGAILALRAAFGLFDADLVRLADALEKLVRAHRATVLLGRTWLQPATPVTFGLKAAGWLDAVNRSRSRLEELRARVLVLEFGGAAGTLASLGRRGLAVAERTAEILQLALPDAPWHAARDRIAETGTVLGVLVGSLGKLARDVALLMQAEVGEAFEPQGPGRGGSSTMPHKHNPVGCAAILAAATRVPGLVATLLAAMPQEHERGLGGWHAEWETLPEICLLTAGALAHAVDVVDGLVVAPARMRANLDATHGVVTAEGVALTLTRGMDRARAHALVEGATKRALDEQRPLHEVLVQMPEVTAVLAPGELERLCDPANYLGLADTWSERVLLRHAARPRSEKGPS